MSTGDIDHRRLKAGLNAEAITASSRSPVAAYVDYPISYWRLNLNDVRECGAGLTTLIFLALAKRPRMPFARVRGATSRCQSARL